MLSICKYLISVMCSAKRADRKAFSLVEALVASLIVGYCLLPVVGTMQSGEKLTERIVHSEKLRMLARSRLNLETSAANNEQKLINTSPNYHYVYLKSGSDQLQFIDTNLAPASFSLDTSVEEVVYTYEVNVAVDDDVYLEPAVGLPAKYVRGLNGLKSLVVTAKLLPNGTDVEEELTFTLVSLITVPMVSQQHAWAIDARQNKVLSFDPYSGMLNLTKTIDFPTPANLHLRPSFVFPHPNDKTVFVYSAAGTYGLNTDNSDSTYYAGLATYTAPTTPGRFSLDTSKNTSVRNYLSRPFLMAMRPDGKYVYSMSKDSDGDIFADGYASSTLSVVNPSGQSLVSNLTYNVGVYGSVNTSNVNFLVAGADGNLYFGPVPKIGDPTVSVLGRMPMYGLQLPKYQELQNFVSTTHDIIDAAISPDGETLCLLFKPNSGTNYLLYFFDSKSAAPIVKSELNAVAATAITDVEYSGDGRYICLVDKNSGMYLFDTTDHNLYSSGNNLASLPYAKAPGSMKPEYAVYSQETNSFIIDDVASSSVISLDCEEFAANKYSAKIPDENIFQLAPEKDSIVHVNAKKTDYIYVATSDGTSDFNIHCVDQHSGAINYDREITLSKEPYDVALTSMGEKLSVTYGDNLAKVEAYNAITATRTFELSLTDNNYTVAALNEGYSKNQRGNTAFILDSTVATVKTNNGYAFDFENTFNKQSESINMASSWECKQIVGLNGGGFLALAGKPDGTSLIDWYGKNSVGSYTRNARWISGVTAKLHSKDLPEEMLPSVSAATGPDSWKGYTIIYVGTDIPVGSKITKVRFESSGCVGVANAKYVTPVLLEKQSDGSYLVKDYGQGIIVDEDGETEESITWKVKGIIENANFFPGLWSGNPTSGKVYAGVSKYNFTTPKKFKAGIGTVNTGSDESKIYINKSVSNMSTSPDRDYQIQFMAEESVVAAESFPPKFVQDLAISRDDRVLALVASDSVSQSVKFYDFAANNFSNETQLKGMVADYRMQSLDLTNSAVIPGLSHKETTGVKLKDAITSNESAWTSIKDYPANYNESGVSDLRVGTDKRFFGYYSSYTKDGTLSPVKSFATATKGKTRLFADQLLSMYDAVWQRFYDNYFRINNADAHESLVQFDQAGNGERKIREFSAVSISGWESLFPYLYSTGSMTLEIKDFTVISPPKGIDANVFKSYYSLQKLDGLSMEFRLPINSYGNVKVDLMFCESYFSASDKRLFDISIEGKTVETNLDIFREAGGNNIALLRTYDTEVFDGVLNVKFTNLSPTCDNAMISGIRVTYTDKNTPDLYFYCKADSTGTVDTAPYTDTYGFVWNTLSIPVGAKVTGHPLTLSDVISIPDGTTKEIFLTPYLLQTGSAFTCSIPFAASKKADITIYYIEHYHTLDTLAGKRKFNVYIEGEKRENELNVFKESGGAKKGFARRYSGINVTGGSIDIKFEKGSADVPLFCGVSVSYIGSSQKLQNGGIFTQTDLSKLNGSVTTGSGYAATTDMGNGWNKIPSESVTPFRFEPVYMGEEEIDPASYLYRKMLFGRDVASPTLFLFSNRRVTSTAGKALEIRRVPLNGAPDKKDYSGLVMTDVAISEDGQNIFVSAAKDLRKINVAASLGDTERIATFSSPVTHLANKPFVRYKSTPASGTITDLGTVFPEARWGSNNTVIASSGIYIAGGTDSGGNALNKIYQYDVFANNLTWVATLSESLSKHSMAAYDDSLYLFNGSRDIASFSESVTKYCVTTRTNLDSNKGYEEAIFDSADVTIVSPTGPATGVTDSEIGVASYSSEPDGNNKVVSWNNGKEKTDKVPNAFDRDDSSEWKLSRYDKSKGTRYVQVEYVTEKVCVNKFRIYRKDRNLGTCQLLASNDGSSWVKFPSVKLGNKKDSYVDVKNTTKYKYYRLNLLTGFDSQGRNKKSKIKEITLYATDVITNTKTVPDTGMHRTLDDNLAPVAVTNNAACTTPYGIMVAGGYAGSGFVDSSSNPGTTTALIYWPHAIGGVYEETNDKLYGISRSVPSLPEPSVDNCMVWHKGKVYCFGGTKTSGASEFHLPFIFNFETNTWSKANSAILGVGHLKRRKAAAVSFGDEIFLFGGECSVTTSFAVAWNTSTNVVREVFSAPPAKLGKYNVSAAAFGSHIYLFGGRDSVNTSVGAKNGIYRFTP